MTIWFSRRFNGVKKYCSKSISLSFHPQHTTVYEEVSIKGTKRWKDESGKSRQKTKKFYQTLSPWNTKDGRLKTRNEIMKEIQAEREEWMNSK